MEELATFFQLQLLQGHILGHSREVGVNEGVRVSLATLALVATVVEPSGHEHFPNLRVSPVVGLSLRPDVNVEVIVVTLEVCGHRVSRVPVKANHIILQLFEGLVEGGLVLLALTLSIADLATTIANENQDTPLVNAIETCNIGHTVRVEEEKSPAVHIVVFCTLMLEVTLWARALELVLRVGRNLAEIFVVICT